MAEKPTWEQIERDRDEPVSLPLDPEDALRGLLKTPPADEPPTPKAQKLVWRDGDAKVVKRGEPRPQGVGHPRRASSDRIAGASSLADTA